VLNHISISDIGNCYISRCSGTSKIKCIYFLLSAVSPYLLLISVSIYDNVKLLVRKDSFSGVFGEALHL